MCGERCTSSVHFRILRAVEKQSNISGICNYQKQWYETSTPQKVCLESYRIQVVIERRGREGNACSLEVCEVESETGMGKMHEEKKKIAKAREDRALEQVRGEERITS